jgi:hypothetical protein
MVLTVLIVLLIRVLRGRACRWLQVWTPSGMGLISWRKMGHGLAWGQQIRLTTATIIHRAYSRLFSTSSLIIRDCLMPPTVL